MQMYKVVITKIDKLTDMKQAEEGYVYIKTTQSSGNVHFIMELTTTKRKLGHLFMEDTDNVINR